MSAPLRGTLLLATLLLTLPLLACGAGGSADPIVVGGAFARVDHGDPALASAPGYAGSAACETCHPDHFADWAETNHGQTLRTTDRVGPTGMAVVADSDGDGTDDFREGLDLGFDADFAAFGESAPRLGYVAGDEYPHKVAIGADTYDVWRTIGGNGFAMQRYLTRIGESSYPLPVQYNETSGDWVPYAVDVWYDGGGAALLAVAPEDSFDLGCLGCHSTGLEIEFDAAAGQYVTGYREIAIGCEACHGPGQAHVEAAGDPALILDPDDLLDGSEAGAVASALICGRCHSQGEGGIPPGGAHPTGYPWKTGGSTFPPGATNIEDYFTFTRDPEKFWRLKDNPMSFTPTPADPDDDTWLAARAGEMHLLDHAAGVHSPDGGGKPACFSCHDVHRRNEQHHVRTEVAWTGIPIGGLTVEENSFCLACHFGRGDFAAVGPADVEAIDGSDAPASVVAATLDHMMDHAAMPLHESKLDPAGTGAGRCTSCHQVMLALTAVAGEDAAGNVVGDLHTHTFEVIWPNISEITNPRATNSCNACHPLAPGDETAEVIAQWATDPDSDGTFHADTPRTFQGGVANPGRDGGIACVACHTTGGFLAIQAGTNGIHDLTEDDDADRRAEILLHSVRRDEGITCKACHGRTPAGGFLEGPNPLRFPKDELCGRCHNNQSVRFIDYRDAGEVVRHPQREMLAGGTGAEVPGENYTGSTSIHTRLVGSDCTACHYRAGADRLHSFEPTLDACRDCHPGLASFNRLDSSSRDYDGDGFVEGIQDELTGSVERLTLEILGAATSTGATITRPGSTFEIDGDDHATDELDPVADAAILRAMFNVNFVEFDASRGVHNTAYALQLIQRSFEELTGQPWPGVVR